MEHTQSGRDRRSGGKNKGTVIKSIIFQDGRGCQEISLGLDGIRKNILFKGIKVANRSSISKIMIRDWEESVVSAKSYSFQSVSK